MPCPACASPPRVRTREIEQRQGRALQRMTSVALQALENMRTVRCGPSHSGAPLLMPEPSLLGSPAAACPGPCCVTSCAPGPLPGRPWRGSGSKGTWHRVSAAPLVLGPQGMFLEIQSDNMFWYMRAQITLGFANMAATCLYSCRLPRRRGIRTSQGVCTALGCPGRCDLLFSGMDVCLAPFTL